MSTLRHADTTSAATWTRHTIWERTKLDAPQVSCEVLHMPEDWFTHSDGICRDSRKDTTEVHVLSLP